MIFERKNDIYIQFNNGGFYNFDNTSILDTQFWLSYLIKENEDINDKIYQEIIEYLDTKPDNLDFDPKNAENMKWFITNLNLPENILDLDKNIKLNKNSKYFERLHIFDYIGVKYFNYENDEI